MSEDAPELQRAIDYVNADHARIAEQAEGIRKLKGASPTRCQPGRAVDVWQEDNEDVGEDTAENIDHAHEAEPKAQEDTPDDADTKEDNRADTAEAAGVETKRARADTMPEYIVDALIAKLDKIEDELRIIDRKIKILNEEKQAKEEEYRGVCRYMGVGAV